MILSNSLHIDNNNSIQENIEKTLRKEAQKYKKIAISQREIIKKWAPRLLEESKPHNKRRSSSSTSNSNKSLPVKGNSSPSRSIRSSQSPSVKKDDRIKQQERYDRERYIIPDKYAPSSPMRPRSPSKETVRLQNGILSHGSDFLPGGSSKIPDVPPPLPRSPYNYDSAKPHKEITPSKVRKTRSPTRKTLNNLKEKAMKEVMREAEELIQAATKINIRTKTKSSSLSPVPKVKKTNKQRSKSTSSVSSINNRKSSSLLSSAIPEYSKESKPIKKRKMKKKSKSVTAMALKREVNKILKEIANEQQ